MKKKPTKLEKYLFDLNGYIIIEKMINLIKDNDSPKELLSNYFNI